MPIEGVESEPFIIFAFVCVCDRITISDCATRHHRHSPCLSQMDVQQMRGILSGLWSSDHIGLSIRELNNLVAEFVAAPKRTLQ